MPAGSEENRINPFITNLSLLNVIFSFSMTLFSFTIIYYLGQHHENVLLAGYGLSAGEAIMLFTMLPIGRSIDRGHSFILMIIGSMVYGVALLLIYYVVSYSILPYVLIPLLVAVLLLFQSTFRTAMNSFIAKAISSKVLGSNYARILTMETIGTAIAFGIFAFASYYSHIGMIYFLPGIILVVLTILVFSVLSATHRSELQKEEGKTKRPGLRESFSGMRQKRDFLAPLISSKVFMTIGVIGFTYFYIPTGLLLNISPVYTSLALLATYGLAAVWGKIGEKIVDKHQDMGKTFVSLAMFIDIITFGLILFSFEFHNKYTFIAAALFSSPGTLLISGAMSFEATVIGRENRGMFGAIQRVVVGAASIVMTFLLTYFYVSDYRLMWEIVFGSSVISFILSVMIPASYSSHPEATAS